MADENKNQEGVNQGGPNPSNTPPSPVDGPGGGGSPQKPTGDNAPKQPAGVGSSQPSSGKGPQSAPGVAKPQDTGGATPSAAPSPAGGGASSPASPSGGGPGAGDGQGGSQGPPQPPESPVVEEVQGGDFSDEKSKKGLMIVLTSVIVLAAAAVAVYFFLLAPESGQQDVTSQQEQVEEQADPAEPIEETDEPMEEVAEENMEEEAGSEEIEEDPLVPSGDSTSTEDGDVVVPAGDDDDSNEMPVSDHQRFFSDAPLRTVNTQSDTITVSGFNGIISSLDQASNLRELVLADNNNNLIRFEELVGALAPSVFSEELLLSFESDYGLFTYGDDDGMWVGVVGQLSSDSDQASISSQISAIEENISEVKNFYAEDPGQPGSWSDGGVGDVSSRYLPFDVSGASFNYGWSDNLLIMTTSFSAFQEAVNQL